LDLFSLFSSLLFSSLLSSLFFYFGVRRVGGAER